MCDQQVNVIEEISRLLISLRCSGVRKVTTEDEADMAAFPIDEEADLKAVGAKGPFGEKV
jgi:hypothetical protein